MTSTATEHSTATGAQNAASTIRLSGPDGVLETQTGGDLPVTASTRTFGDEPLGRGPRVPIPTHVTFEASDIQLHARQPRSWFITLTASPSTERTTR